jgi:hypothetical protein
MASDFPQRSMGIVREIAGGKTKNRVEKRRIMVRYTPFRRVEPVSSKMRVAARAVLARSGVDGTANA